MMKFDEVKRMLDKKATYFWQRREDGRYALVNCLTLKTALGVRYRIDALKMQETLSGLGYHIDKLNDGEII